MELLRTDYLPVSLIIIPGVLCVVAIIASLLLKQDKLYFYPPVMIPALLLGVWASFAMAVIGDVNESRPYWLVIVLLFIIPNIITLRIHLVRAGWLLALSLGAVGLYVFVSKLIVYITGYDVTAEGIHAATLTIGEKNSVGMWLVMGFPFALNLFEYHRFQFRKRFWLLISATFMIAGILATLSIGAFIGLLVTFALQAWYQPNVSGRFRYFFFVIALLVMAAIGPLASRLQDRQLLSFNGRGFIWRAAIQTIANHPFWGIGSSIMRNQQAMLPYLNDAPFVQYWKNMNLFIVPHNIFLSVGVEIGIPGLLLYLALLGAVFLSLRRLRLNIKKLPNKTTALYLTYFSNALIISTSSALVQGMALSAHLDKYVWLIFGLIVSTANIVKSSQKEDVA